MDNGFQFFPKEGKVRSADQREDKQTLPGGIFSYANMAYQCYQSTDLIVLLTWNWSPTYAGGLKPCFLPCNSYYWMDYINLIAAVSNRGVPTAISSTIGASTETIARSLQSSILAAPNTLYVPWPHYSINAYPLDPVPINTRMMLSSSPLNTHSISLYNKFLPLLFLSPSSCGCPVLPACIPSCSFLSASSPELAILPHIEAQSYLPGLLWPASLDWFIFLIDDRKPSCWEWTGHKGCSLNGRLDRPLLYIWIVLSGQFIIRIRS